MTTRTNPSYPSGPVSIKTGIVGGIPKGSPVPCNQLNAPPLKVEPPYASMLVPAAKALFQSVKFPVHPTTNACTLLPPVASASVNVVLGLAPGAHSLCRTLVDCSQVVGIGANQLSAVNGEAVPAEA